MNNKNDIEKDIIDKFASIGDVNPICADDWKIIMKRMRKVELDDCLVWLQNRMDEYSDKEIYKDDYKIVSTIWNLMRSRIEM